MNREPNFKFREVVKKMVGRDMVIDCKPVAEHAGLKVMAHNILFCTKMFDTKVKAAIFDEKTQSLKGPYENTVTLLQSFLDHASELKSEVKTMIFVAPYGDINDETWNVKVTAHKKGDIYILTFKETEK